MELAIQILGLVTGLVALVTAALGMRKAVFAVKELERQQNEIAALRRTTSEVALSFEIISPKENAKIKTGIYNDMEGFYAGEIPEGHKLWVIAKDPYHYFLMHPPTQVTPTMKRWSQQNIRLATNGKWQLHVVLANKRGSDWFKDRAKHEDWSGFPELPEGAATVRYVAVQRV